MRETIFNPFMTSFLFLIATKHIIIMARITEELIRRRSEHNNLEITTLEEISLHQQDIEKIEHLDKWCRNLKILYLQSNLIPKIENVGRLKYLEYLNLALNNITKIENLSGCESLQKLDFTVNFIGDLLSLESLKVNEHLKEIYLTGNPCTDYEGYRDFVIGTLPQLQWLDGREITKSERITALQRLPELRLSIEKQQLLYEEEREREKEREEERERDKAKPGFNSRWYTDPNAHVSSENGGTTNNKRDSDDKEDENFMKEPVSHTPESRVALHKHLSEKRQTKTQETKPAQRERRLERNGVMLNINEGKYEFHLTEDDDNNQFVLDVSCPRFMDSSLVDCQVHPTFVRIVIKGKILQLVLQEEVSPDRSEAKRSQTTGHLLVTMPKSKPVLRPKRNETKAKESRYKERDIKTGQGQSDLLLEVSQDKPSIFNIVKEDETHVFSDPPPPPPPLKPVSDDFVDDPDVPPLI